ncbi:unnamed protein product [Gadus morhua 'NCC']
MYRQGCANKSEDDSHYTDCFFIHTAAVEGIPLFAARGDGSERFRFVSQSAGRRAVAVPPGFASPPNGREIRTKMAARRMRPIEEQGLMLTAKPRAALPQRGPGSSTRRIAAPILPPLRQLQGFLLWQVYAAPTTGGGSVTTNAAQTPGTSRK